MRINRQLYDFFMNKNFIRERRYYPEVYLGAKDSKGILRQATLLNKEWYGGCEIMPSISSTVLTEAYVDICKNGLIPHCLIRVFHIDEGFSLHRYRDYCWNGYSSGSSIYAIKNGILTFGIHNPFFYSSEDNYMIYERNIKVSPTYENWSRNDCKIIKVGITDA